MAMVNVVTIAAYMRIYWLRLIGLVQRLAATWRCVLHSSDEPGELSQWQCSVHCYDDSTTNIVVPIIIIIIIITSAQPPATGKTISPTLHIRITHPAVRLSLQGMNVIQGLDRG